MHFASDRLETESDALKQKWSRARAESWACLLRISTQLLSEVKPQQARLLLIGIPQTWRARETFYPRSHGVLVLYIFERLTDLLFVFLDTSPWRANRSAHKSHYFCHDSFRSRRVERLRPSAKRFQSSRPVIQPCCKSTQMVQRFSYDRETSVSRCSTCSISTGVTGVQNSW
jgi:hypothetical protein